MAYPAIVVHERNNYEYVCVLPIDPNSGVVIVDTKSCEIRKGDKQVVATRISGFLRSAGIPVKIVG